jgi:hypothetical protein
MPNQAQYRPRGNGPPCTGQAGVVPPIADSHACFEPVDQEAEVAQPLSREEGITIKKEAAPPQERL